MEKKEMTVLLIEPEARPKVVTMETGLKPLQEAVGGYIEAVYPFDDPVALVCNEEGKLLNLPMCRSLHEAEDIICGSFFICGAPADAENFTSLTSEQMKRYEERFHFPEVFLPVSNKGVFVLSCQ